MWSNQHSTEMYTFTKRGVIRNGDNGAILNCFKLENTQLWPINSRKVCGYLYDIILYSEENQ